MIDKFMKLDIYWQWLVVIGICVLLQLIIKIVLTTILIVKSKHIRKKAEPDLQFSDDAPSN